MATIGKEYKTLECPYCPTDCPTELLNYDEFTMHVLSKHPDKTSLEDVKEIKRSRLWGTATELTAITVGTERADRNVVLENFKFFLKSLMDSGL